jgi:hypothetical protein
MNHIHVVILSEASQPHREAESKDPCISPVRARSRKIRNWLTLSGAVLFLFSVQALGQGCTQCLDSTRATPPAVRAAYRHAIYLLGGAGAAVFVAGTLLLRRER